MEDSYARGHVRRTLTNPQDQLQAGNIDDFKAGKYGIWGDVENFHCYKGQDETAHDRYDQVPPFRGINLDPTNLDSFNALLGARDAIGAAIKLLNFFKSGTAWASAGGPKEFLEGTVFNPHSPDDALILATRAAIQI